jgi:hypothetical protein
MPKVQQEIDIFPSYRLIYLFADDSVAEKGTMFDAEILGRQGFYWQPGFIHFTTLGDCPSFRIEVVVLDADEEFEIHPDSVRVIQLPFEVTASGIYITSCDPGNEAFIEVPNDCYAILFEVMLDSKPEIVNSPDCDIEGGFSYEFCRITLRPTDSPVEARILRSDINWTPPYDLAVYTPLNPPDPLVLGV